MTKEIVADRGWLSLTTAARDYVHISPDVLRRGISAGELPAYKKPLTRGRKPGATRENTLMRIHTDDIDDWIRRTWEPVCKEAVSEI